MTDTQPIKKPKKKSIKVPVKAKAIPVEAPLEPLAPKDLTKLPQTIQGPGYKLVNLNSMDRAYVFIESSEAADKLYNWNSDCVPYSAVVRLELEKKPLSLPLSSCISQPNFARLAVEFPVFYQQLQQTVLARRALIQQLIDENGPIPFELLAEILTTFMHKYMLFAVNGREYYGKLQEVRVWDSMFSGPKLIVKFTKLIWDEGKLKTKLESLTIRPDTKAKSLAEWGITTSLTHEKLNELFARGVKTVELNEKCAYIQVKGNITYRVSWFVREALATGRAIVDRAGHAIFNPNDRDDDFDRSEAHDINLLDATPDEMRSVDPALTVFSFAAKKWGKVDVSQVNDITFRDDSFHKLVMPDEDKRLVHTLVKNSDSSLTSDLVDGKGGGCVLLLHGKPGLGKTLTAEAVAETLKRPLYAVSVGELGTNPEVLEENLQTVLQTAQRWNAVLLLDEADVFLEARKSGDINRNAMVGTFLRLLEYYNGVLILTTNRVEDMDKAFYSRISLALRYNDFGAETREQVVQNLLSVNDVHLTSNEIKEIAGMDVNGRQIKNSIRIARFMAKDEARAVRVEDILSVLNKLQDFQDSFTKVF